MGGRGTHGGTTYKGYTMPHNKRWYTVAGKGLCAVTWFWIFYRAKQDSAVLLGMLCVTSSIILTSSNIFYLAFLFFQQTLQEIHNLMRQDDTIWSVKHKICSGHVFVGAMGCVIHHKYHKKDDNTMSAKYDESKEMEVLKDPTQSPCINQVLIASLMLGVNLVVLQ